MHLKISVTRNLLLISFQYLDSIDHTFHRDSNFQLYHQAAHSIYCRLTYTFWCKYHHQLWTMHKCVVTTHIPFSFWPYFTFKVKIYLRVFSRAPTAVIWIQKTTSSEHLKGTCIVKPSSRWRRLMLLINSGLFELGVWYRAVLYRVQETLFKVARRWNLELP